MKKLIIQIILAGIIIFHEKIGKKKMLALSVILLSMILLNL